MMYKILSKLIFTFLAVLMTAEVMAQVPQGFNFQAVARDADGELIANSELGVRVSVLQGSETGTAVYTEVQNPTTSTVGSFELVIGEGTSDDDFSSVDWSSDNYYVKLEIDPAGGEEYEELGTTRLLSVPYALLAQDVVNGNGSSGVSLPLELTGSNGNMSVTLGTQEGDNNYGFVGLGNADGDTLVQIQVENFGDTVSQARMQLRDSFGRFSQLSSASLFIGNSEDGTGFRSRLHRNSLFFDNLNIDTPAPPAWFGTYQGDGFYQILDFTETGAYEGGILSGFWPGQPTIMLEDGNETPLVILEAQKHDNRNLGVLTLRGTDGSEFSITSDGIDGSSTAKTQYDLNTSEGDTSFIVNATGTEGLVAIRGNASTDGSNRGVFGAANSESSNSNTMYGVTGTASGEGTGPQLGVFGSAYNEQASGGSRYGVYGQAASKAKYNNGVRGLAFGTGNGDEGTGFGEGSINFGVYGYAEGNTWNNSGVEANATGDVGKWNFGVHGLSSAGSGTSVENHGVAGRASGPGINYGIYGQAWDGVENWAGYFDGNVKVNGDIEHTGSITQTSDRNLKENIQPLQDGLGTIMKLNPTTYNFRGNGEYNGLKLSTGLHYGLIAQEVEEVLPSLVKNNVHTYSEISSSERGPVATSEIEITKTMEYKTMNYTELVPILVKAVQEQQEEIQELKEEIEKLKEEREIIRQLQKEVEALKKDK